MNWGFLAICFFCLWLGELIDGLLQQECYRTFTDIKRVTYKREVPITTYKRERRACGLFGWSTCYIQRPVTSFRYITDVRLVPFVARACCEGWTGASCETKIKQTPQCTTDYCESGGSCIVQGESLACVCMQGYEGKRCEVATAPKCSPDFCQNGGTCLVRDNQLRCSCAETFTGDHCEDHVTTTERVTEPTTHLTTEHVTTTERGSTPTTEHATTAHVTTPEFNSCDPSPCRNAGICMETNGFSCFCMPGFSGKFCEVVDTVVGKSSACSSRPCFNAGSCLDWEDGSFLCICMHGFSGTVCEKETEMGWALPPQRPILRLTSTSLPLTTTATAVTTTHTSRATSETTWNPPIDLGGGRDGGYGGYGGRDRGGHGSYDHGTKSGYYPPSHGVGPAGSSPTNRKDHSFTIGTGLKPAKGDLGPDKSPSSGFVPTGSQGAKGQPGTDAASEDSSTSIQVNVSSADKDSHLVIVHTHQVQPPVSPVEPPGAVASGSADRRPLDGLLPLPENTTISTQTTTSGTQTTTTVHPSTTSTESKEEFPVDESTQNITLTPKLNLTMISTPSPDPTPPVLIKHFTSPKVSYVAPHKKVSLICAFIFHESNGNTIQWQRNSLPAHNYSERHREMVSIVDQMKYPNGQMAQLSIVNTTRSDLGKYHCVARSQNEGRYLTNKVVVELTAIFVEPTPLPSTPDDNKNVDDTAAIIVIVLLCCMLIVTVFVLPFVIFKHRRYIKLRTTQLCGKYEDSDDKEYDVFVSYCADSQEDEDFVVRVLVPTLEDKLFMRVCVEYRDFMPGEAIALNVIKAVEKSRRTILVLSPRFVENGWCRYHFLNAQIEMMNKKQQIIPLMFENIEDMKNVDKDLKNLLKIVKYVAWPAQRRKRKQEAFWDYLRLLLPKKRTNSLSNSDVMNQNTEQSMHTSEV